MGNVHDELEKNAGITSDLDIEVMMFMCENMVKNPRREDLMFPLGVNFERILVIDVSVVGKVQIYHKPQQ